MIDPLSDSTLTSDAALQSAALDLLYAAEALMQEPDDDVARDRMLAAIAKARGGSVAEVTSVVAVHDRNCWNCEHNTTENTCRVSEYGSGALMEQTDEWISEHVLDWDSMMPARQTRRACPGFKRAVKS